MIELLSLSAMMHVRKGVYTKRDFEPVIKTQKGFTLKEWEVRIPHIYTKSQRLQILSTRMHTHTQPHGHAGTTTRA